MISDWKDFLENQGARIRDDEVLGFPEASGVESEQLLADLSMRGLLAVTGADAGKFLQGQLTCNVEELSLEHSSLGACCNNKGRMVASFRIVQAADGYLLEMDRGLIPVLIEHLKKFIVFFKAEMLDASDTLVRIGCMGAQLNDAIAKATGTLPDSINQVGEQHGNFIIRVHGAPARYEIWATPEDAPRIWEQLAGTTKPVGWNHWLLEEIRAGIGFVAAQTHEAFTPQMLNYQLLDAISFTKGCYTGQEIVARTQYRGAIKRHMVRAKAQSSLPILPGAQALGSDERPVGEVVASADTGLGSQELLLVLHNDALEGVEITLDVEGKPAAGLLDLPYSAINE